jgi:hypothetical protein
MQLRFKCMVLLAFALGQLAMGNLSSAIAATPSITMSVNYATDMANCAMSDHCCDFGSIDNCSLCVACVGYAPAQPIVAPIKLRQSYHVANPLTLFSLFNSLDPPPPRGAL